MGVTTASLGLIHSAFMMNVGAGPGTRTQSVLAGTTSAAIVFWTA